MNYTVSEVLQFVRENDVKFIRLAFCDIFGVQKNISIMPAELPRAFENGISFDASAVRGFLNVDESDLFLFPDPATLSILPWRPAHSRVVRMLCDIRRPDGTLFEGDTRGLLRRAVADAARMGLQCRVGAECEFYLFERDEAGEPTMIPHDRGGYFDVSPRDKGENVRREICLTLEEMGIQPESSHHEQGPGQNEIDFKYSDALTAADNLITSNGWCAPPRRATACTPPSCPSRSQTGAAAACTSTFRCVKTASICSTTTARSTTQRWRRLCRASSTACRRSPRFSIR